MNSFERFLMPAVSALTRFLVKIKFKQMGMSIQTVHTADGQWVYAKGGQGPALVLIHGFAASKENWLEVAADLIKNYTVYLPDLIGFGESDNPSTASYTVEAQASRVIDFVNALGITQFHVGGNSMGGYITGVLAGRYTSRVLSAWLLNPAGVNGAKHTKVGRAFLEEGKILLVPENHQQYLNILNLCFNDKPPVMPSFILRHFSAKNVGDKVLLKQIFLDFVDPEKNPTLNSVIESSICKILVVWGDQDQLVDVSGLAILKELKPSLHTQLLPNTGHCPMIDRSQLVLQEYASFQSEL